MSEQTNPRRGGVMWLPAVLSACVFAACMYYAFALAFLIPYPGITVNGEWTVTHVDPCESHPGWCVDGQSPIQEGDRLVAIGDLAHDAYTRDRRVTPFAGLGPGDVVPIALRRDGRELAIQWEMPKPSIGDRLSGLAGLLFSLPFWGAGTIVLLLLRPRDLRWRLLVGFNYLTAIWLAAGMVSQSGVAASSLVTHALSWLTVPVYLHLHLLVPTPLLRDRARSLLFPLYAVAAVLAILELVQVVPNWMAYGLGLVLAITGSLGLLVARLFGASARPQRRTVGLMLSSVCLAFGPALVLVLLPGLLGHQAPGELATAVSLLSVPILPFGYTYALYKQRLGVLEFRANRVLATYSFSLLYGTLFAVAYLLTIRAAGVLVDTTAVDIGVSLLFVGAAPYLHARYCRWMNRLIHGTEYSPDEMVRVLASEIPAALSLETLSSVLVDKVTQTLLVRQSALYVVDGDQCQFVYTVGVDPGEIQRALQCSGLSTCRMGEYIPPPVSQTEADNQEATALDWIRLAIPLVVRERTTGGWLFGRRDPEDFYPREDIALLTALSSQVAVAIENIRLFEQAKVEIAEREQAERSLRENQRRLSLLMANLPGMAYRRKNDVDWTMEFASEGCLDLTGYCADDLVGGRGVSYASLIHPEDRQQVWGQVQNALQQRCSFQLSYRISTASGEEKRVWEHGGGVVDEQGVAVALEGFIADVTGQVQAELQVRREAARAQALARIARQLSVQLDVQVVLDTVCKEAALNLDMGTSSVYLCDGKREVLTCASSYGFPPKVSECLPTTSYEVYRRHCGDKTPVLVRDLQSEPGLPWAEHLVELDGHTHVSAAMVHENDVIGVLNVTSYGSVREVTPDELAFLQGLADQAAVAIANARLLEQSRRRLDELSMLNRIGRLMASTLNLETVLERTMHQVVRVLQARTGSTLLLDDESGELVFAAAYGPGGDLLLGHRLPPGRGIAGWVARNSASVVISDARTDERFYDQVDALTGFATQSTVCVPLISHGQVIGVMQALNKIESEFNADDQRLLESLAASAASAIENARLYQALEVERASLARRVEERTADLIVANEELARAARMKDEFLANMSHELRTPLNAILGMSEVLRTGIYGPMDERQLKSIGVIEGSGRHLLNLINDILDVAKIEAGKMELEVGPVSVDAICEASLQFIRQQAISKQITVSSEVDASVTIAEADERRLKQILINLLTNAVKFTPKGGKVGLEVRGDRVRHLLHFVVWDTGIGIASEDLDRLFDPFVQLDSSLSREYTGTGLGLALVRRLAGMHGGHVEVESELGKGSRFMVSLPWQEKATALSEAPDANLEEVVPFVPAPQGALILLAEDDEVNVQTVLDYLEAKGYQVIVARDGAEAVERTKADRPDLVLMDIQMPEVDGLEAIRRIRADEDKSVAATPVIALTALAMPGDQERCLEVGADGYLSKPVRLAYLTEMIERLCADRIAARNGSQGLAETRPGQAAC